MTIELYWSMVLFAAATFFTPGPNNIMLMTSGMNFGFARTRPHLFGVSLGFGVMMLCVGLGLGAVFKAFPAMQGALKVVGSLFLLYLAWRIANAGRADNKDGRSTPLTFAQAAAFQWVNPKAWIIALSVMSIYPPRSNHTFNVALIALTFAFIGTLSAGSWALFGTKIRQFLRSDRAVRLFNITMALLLVASLYPVLIEAAEFLANLA